MAWKMIKETLVKWRRDKAQSLGAALSFYTVLSLPALLVISVGIAGSVFGEGSARNEVLLQVRSWVGADGARTVETVLDATEASGRGSGTTIFGFALLLFTAATVFSQVQSALSLIWESKPPPTVKRGLVAGVRNRLLALAMVLGSGLVLLTLLVTSAMLPLLGDYLNNVYGGAQLTLHLVNIFISVVVIGAVFAVMYRYLPGTRVTWRDAWPGALLAAALFTAGKFIIGIYLGRSNVISAYGASSSLVFLLLWIYYSSQSFFLGAEFGAVYARERRRRPD